MSYLLKSKKEKNGFSRIAFVTLAFLILIVILNFTNPNLFGGFFHTLGTPFWKAGTAISGTTRSVLAYFSSKTRLERENRELRQELFEKNAAQLSFETIRAENEELKTSLERASKKKLLLAYVLKRPGFSPYDTFIIDAGNVDGIKVNERVNVGGDAAIGYVKEVFENTALVRLYSSPAEEIDVRIEGVTKTAVQAIGRGSGNFEIKIPRDLEVEIGSTVLLAGTTEVLGVVEDKEADIAHSLQTLYFRFPFNIQTIERVYVEIPK